MEFLTEKEIEQLLVVEARLLPLPNGIRLRVEAFKLHWQSLDAMTEYGWTQNDISEIAWTTSRRTAAPFDACVRQAIHWLHTGLKNGSVKPF